MTAAGAAPLRFDACRDPEGIRQATFGIIRREAEAALAALPGGLRPLAAAAAYAAGDLAVIPAITGSTDAAARGGAALLNGAPLLVDAEMLSRGISRENLPRASDILCTLGLPGVAGTAARLGTTRSAAAVEFWKPWLGGAVVAIGNAPTALFHLLERLSQGWPKPALVLGFPVGFTGAAESKEALAAHADSLGVPFVTLRGRRGGTAMAAAVVNALARGAA